MADVTLTREEAETGDLPDVCMRCGSPDVNVIQRNFRWYPPFTGALLRLFLTRYMTVFAPLCGQHSGWSWGGPGLWGLRPRHISQDHITLTGVSPAFAEALDDYRTGEGRRRRRMRGDVRGDSGPRRPRPRPAGVPRQPGSAWPWLLGIGLVVGLPALLCAGFMLMPLAVVVFGLSGGHGPGPGPAGPGPGAGGPPPRGEFVAALAVAPDAGFPAGYPWASLVLADAPEPLVLLDDAAIDKLLADLRSNHPATMGEAARKLARAFPVESRRKDVARTLEAALASPFPAARDPAAQALRVWGTEENVPALVKRLDDVFPDRRWPAMDALAGIKDERGAEAVAKRLAAQPDRARARQALEEMGPVAEKATRAALADKDPAVRREACLILQAVGSEDSLPALADAAGDRDPAVAAAAADADRAIRARE
jgi:hypothetical protein